ncbi:MAG: crossover junction endodeoxyribonuclease RuvC [Candidatus Cloacimonetes bacterium HGW-Cloacimonetes-1]|nr:MAG: crossover junction endodeoxyribonuclease RuvC [Candidatus Cloacimonetes bacterium HGW-Cloacimonetes-1]
MLTIGIDPGSRYCGYGLLQYEGRVVIAAGCDVINTNEKLPLPERLVNLYSGICEILDEYKPQQACVESMFFHKHIKSIFTLGHARGVLLLALSQRQIPIFEYTPREIKKAVVGNGNATKEQVRYMIDQLYKLKSSELRDDAADALAIATCHFNKYRFVL